VLARAGFGELLPGLGLGAFEAAGEVNIARQHSIKLHRIDLVSNGRAIPVEG
jgi:hypothetical protein